MLPRKDVKPRFTKSIIKSSKALTYQKAQEIIDDETNDKSDLANDLRRLRDVSKALRAKRMEQGALTLASPEVRFELDDETSNPLDVSLYISRETNKMARRDDALGEYRGGGEDLRALPVLRVVEKAPGVEGKNVSSSVRNS